MHKLMVFSAVCLSLVSATSTARIYKCTHVNGHISYTDHGCAADQVVNPGSQKTLQTTRFTPLSASEVARLHKAQSAANRRQQLLRQSREKQRQSFIAQREEQASLCKSASAALHKLRKRRRQGYSLTEHKQLQQKEFEHQRTKVANC